jgi:hypothetical protein
MMNDDRSPYRWQDHVVSPQRAATNLMATVLIVLALSAGALFTVACTADPPPPTVAHIATERTPPLSQLAKRPARARSPQDLM